jgi:hypothetical protein
MKINYLGNKKFYKQNNFKKINKKNEDKISNYLIINKKIRKGVFLKKPTYREVMYPVYLNLKLVNEFLKR